MGSGRDARGEPDAPQRGPSAGGVDGVRAQPHQNRARGEHHRAARSAWPAAQVARIGNNINQIARQANMRDEATYGQIMEAQAQLRELRGLLATLRVEASRQVEPEGRPGWL